MLRQFKVISGDDLAFGQSDRAADTIDQFPDVPRPAVVMQRCNRVRGKAMYLARAFIAFIFKPFKCVHCKLGDVFSSHAKRGFPNLKHAKPEKEVRPKPALRHSSLHVLVRCSDHPYVHIDRLKATQAFNLAFLDKAQQRDLTLMRKVANFVEEQRSAMRLLDSPYLALRGTCERSALIAEQFRMQQIRCTAPQFTATKGILQRSDCA